MVGWCFPLPLHSNWDSLLHIPAPELVIGTRGFPWPAWPRPGSCFYYWTNKWGKRNVRAHPGMAQSHPNYTTAMCGQGGKTTNVTKKYGDASYSNPVPLLPGYSARPHFPVFGEVNVTMWPTECEQTDMDHFQNWFWKTTTLHAPLSSASLFIPISTVTLGPMCWRQQSHRQSPEIPVLNFT